MIILVTGGTGVLGRAVVARLRDAGHDMRAMSRRSGPDRVTGDLLTGVGIADAVRDADVIVHSATSRSSGPKDVAATRNLVAAARAAGNPHLVYISIVGIDRIPLGYYRGKLDAERVIADSGLPYTILRATQFHNLLRVLFAVTAKLPVMFVPDLRFQPIDVGDVADRVAELATAQPAGPAPDLGGPEVRSAVDLARTYLAATGRRRLVLPVRLPGRIFSGYRTGANLTPSGAVDGITFERYLAGRLDLARLGYR